MPPTVIDLHATTKILDCPRVVASPSMSLRIIIILFSSVRRSTFQKLRKSSNRGPVFAPRLRRDATGNTDDRENADHSQFWCLLVGPAESKPNRRITKAKTIGVMFMASCSSTKNHHTEKAEQNTKQWTCDDEPEGNIPA